MSRKPPSNDSVRGVMEAIVMEAAKLGEDVEVRNLDEGVALRRVRDFAFIRKSGSAQVDLGLVMPTAHSSSGRLRSYSSATWPRVTHIVTLTSAGEVDTDVQDWIRLAYDSDGERRRSSRDDE
jgi:hypothetical protein